MNYETTKSTDKEVYVPLIDKSIYDIDELDDDDKIQPKCFAFKDEIKITLKYILKECPKIF